MSINDREKRNGVGSNGASTDDLAQRLRAIKKAELHVHLRGILGPNLLLQFAEKTPPKTAVKTAPERHLHWFNSYPPIARFLSETRPTLELIEPLYQGGPLLQFLTTYLLTGYFIKTTEDLTALIQNGYSYLTEEGISYAEITVSVPEYLQQGFTLEQILTCLEDTPAPEGLRVVWIVDLVRNFGAPRAEQLVQDIASFKPVRIVGITIGGDERNFPPDDFKTAYTLARAAGLRCSVHAGEACGAESVWSAVRELKTDRIGHGVRAIEDPALVEHLAKHEIPLEVCPTGNVSTGVVASYRDHPAKQLYDAGVPITINTDDPAFFGRGLSAELAALVDLGFEEPQILQIIKNGFSYAFRP